MRGTTSSVQNGTATAYDARLDTAPVYAWSPDGILLAVGSRSSGMRVFPGHLDLTGK
jgi:hypothetical protein